MRSGLRATPRSRAAAPTASRACSWRRGGAARLLAQDDGPRLAALAFDGWDTHANEGGATGRLAQLLGGLDGALAEFENGAGRRAGATPRSLVVTEFGRTARRSTAPSAPTTAPAPSRSSPAAR